MAYDRLYKKGLLNRSKQERRISMRRDYPGLNGNRSKPMIWFHLCSRFLRV